ncbi:phage tail sheath family protein [Undibacterium sp. Di26W]|uniref:phage tail sheath family protein n=1 Tax=Undibacterium sp. Di26W TaxID=3413035 RepID=UPI003BF3A453
MTSYSHPGLYISEVQGNRSIQGASTSIAAFVGVTATGYFEQVTMITSWNAYQTAFGGLAWYAMVPWSVFEFFIEGGAACYVVRASDTKGATPASATAPLALTAVTPGLWGNALCVSVSNGSATDSSVTPTPQTPVFTVTIYADASMLGLPLTSASSASGSSTAATSPTLPNLLLQQFVLQNTLTPVTISGKSYYMLEQYLGCTANNMDIHVADVPSLLATRINNMSIFVRVPASASASVTKGVRPTNGGPTAFSGGTEPNYDLEAAINLLETFPSVSLLSVPDTVTATDDSSKPSQLKQGTLINSGLQFCEKMSSLFYVVDPPFNLKPQDMLSFKSGNAAQGVANANKNALNSEFGAIYYPWVYIYNALVDANVPIPPSGPVLGRYASTDNSVGVFKSPAGVRDGALQSVLLLGQTLSDSDQDQINDQGINAIRNFVTYGNVIWGARTLSADTQWKYVSVRRLFIYVEQSLKQSLQWVVFEPNDQKLWSAVTRDIGAFLTTLWQQGGLFGATAHEAFFVACDGSNNSPDTRQSGQLYIDIGLAPVFPAEFVILRFTQKTSAPGSGT